MTNPSPAPRRRQRRGVISRLFERSTGDIMILMIAATLCAGVIVIGTSVLLFSFLNPKSDVTAAFRFITNILNTMIGLLAGYLAGRTEAHHPPPFKDEDDHA